MNYGPVSGLCFFSKLVEGVQSAYKVGHSTVTAPLSIKNEIHFSSSQGEASALVLLDQSAAFDTIDHSSLNANRYGSALVTLY